MKVKMNPVPEVPANALHEAEIEIDATFSGRTVLSISSYESVTYLEFLSPRGKQVLAIPPEQFRHKPEIEFNTNEYEQNHGRTPRGRGTWAFCPTESYGYDYLKHTSFFQGTYSEARNKAKLFFERQAQGYRYAEVTVCP